MVGLSGAASANSLDREFVSTELELAFGVNIRTPHSLVVGLPNRHQDCARLQLFCATAAKGAGFAPMPPAPLTRPYGL
jgi:hypothetical protein